MCRCKSYNKETGTVPEKILTAPDWSDRKTICIDSCIADVIAHLWDNGIVTLGSCCGHNKASPSIVLGNGESNYPEIISLICSTDNRDWVIKQWRLVTMVTITK